MNEALLVKGIRGKRQGTKKSRSALATALCFCLLGISEKTFSQVPIAKQIDSINQTVLEPSTSSGEYQTSANPTSKFGPPYTYTADQLRDMLLKVATLKNVPKDGAEILEVFKLPVSKFINMQPPNLFPKEKGFSLKLKPDQYFNLSYFYDDEFKTARFVFFWSEDPAVKSVQHFPLPPVGLCIEGQKMKIALETMGWQFKKTIDIAEFPRADFYSRSDAQTLRMYVSRNDDCLRQIHIWWDKYIFSNFF